MLRPLLTRLLPLLTLAAGPMACNGCDDPLSALGEGKGTDLPVEEQGGPRALTYVGESPLSVVRNDTATLRFTLKELESGAPVVGEPVAIEVSGTAITTTVTAIPTDASGAIDVVIRAGDLLGEATVTARAADIDGKTVEDGVIVRVVEDPAAGLRVELDSTTRIEVDEALVQVYAGVNPPACTTLLAAATPPNGNYQATFTTIPDEQDFEGLTTGHRATVLALGVNDNGFVFAKACETTGALPGGVMTTVSITLEQGETTVEGDYDVLMHMALGDALPSPYDETVDMVTALLSNPAGYALYLALRWMDRDWGTTFVTRDGEEMSYRDVEQNPNAYTTWNLGQDALHEMLLDQLGQTYLDITSVGAGVRDVVTDFEVGGRFAVYESATGALSIDEAWQDIVLYWPLPCDEIDGSIDMACARRPLSLEDDNLAPVLATYGAAYDLAPNADETERFEVVTDPHGLTLRYGALLLAILEQVVFPSLPGDIAADNFGDVLTNIVGCDNIAASISGDPTAALFISSLCETGLDFAAAELEQQLLSLEVESTNVGEEGLAASGTFALVDEDHNLETELVYDYEFNVQWFVPGDPGASNDIAAPIRGDGRRAWATCTDDAQCGTGKSCQARGSYLKVARIELGCNANIGTLAGGTACTNDDQCQGGLCSPVGAGGALVCAEACDGNNDCASGLACNEMGALISLDPMMDGLGDVGFAGCAGF
jgi:hypothetical protein